MISIITFSIIIAFIIGINSIIINIENNSKYNKEFDIKCNQLDLNFKRFYISNCGSLIFKCYEEPYGCCVDSNNKCKLYLYKEDVDLNSLKHYK
ncbi:MAG: hypothetical protein PHR26_04150 [Candidatus ainarchaeum sp.]|nr:hypothetical protein [Candidatus ainarchaeum sp.]